MCLSDCTGQKTPRSLWACLSNGAGRAQRHPCQMITRPFVVQYFNSPELCDTILQAINCITKSKALAGRASFYAGLAKALSFTLCYNSETSGKTFLSVNNMCSHAFPQYQLSFWPLSFLIFLWGEESFYGSKVLGIQTHACKPSTEDTQAGGPWVWGQPDCIMRHCLRTGWLNN